MTFSVANKYALTLLGHDNVSVSNMGDHALMVNGASWNTRVGEYENTVLYANDAELATIDLETGVITLAEDKNAYELLNLFASTGDGMNRTNALLEAKIGIVAYSECWVHRNSQYLTRHTGNWLL
ncbi:MAG: hypothetical protein NC127_01485 [Muribaculum sp.]|nr:hypothetical protein [Muribaculum sp.]